MRFPEVYYYWLTLNSGVARISVEEGHTYAIASASRRTGVGRCSRLFEFIGIFALPQTVYCSVGL